MLYRIRKPLRLVNFLEIIVSNNVRMCIVVEENNFSCQCPSVHFKLDPAAFKTSHTIFQVWLLFTVPQKSTRIPFFQWSVSGNWIYMNFLHFVWSWIGKKFWIGIHVKYSCFITSCVETRSRNFISICLVVLKKNCTIAIFF